jgi:predicted TIM-barrel fold metal-dependent hydrolase
MRSARIRSFRSGVLDARTRIVVPAAAALAMIAGGARADDIRELKLRDWQPRSMLVVKASRVERPASPVIDVHNHLWSTKDVGALVKALDGAGVRTVVNLDGGWGSELRAELRRFDLAHPGRFLTFALIDFKGIDDAGWSARAARRLEADFRAGAKGLKLHKSLGLGVRYKQSGKLVRIDDPKLDPIWALCGRAGKPIMIHSADPKAFFIPLDRRNERWHELNEHPGWLFHGKDYPRYEELLAQLHRVIRRHPKTTFIGAHMASQAEDLATLGRWLDELPNLHVDIDARINELGRQPYTARRFFLKYQDRVMFGTDTAPSVEMYRVYYRFLETEDEYWDSAAGHHRQGFWMIYSVNLPRAVLRKLYHDNAVKVLGLRR